jgi:hypothetical protein
MAESVHTMMRACDIGLFLALALLCCLSVGCAARVEETAASPDGKVVAEVLQSQSAGATDANATYVQLRERGGASADHVLEGTYYGATVTIAWLDSNTLLVRCATCGSDSVTRLQKEKWRDISIHYDIGGGNR